MRGLRHHPRAFPAIPFPPRWRSDACPVMAPAGVPGDGLSKHRMRSLRWRSDARFARVGSRAAAIMGLNYALIINPMGRSCPPNAWRISRAAMIDRNGVCAQSTFQNRADLGRRNGVRLHALVGRHHAGGTGQPAGCAGARRRSRRWRSDAFLRSAVGRDDGRMRSLGWRPRAVLAIPFPTRTTVGCVPLGCSSKAFPALACPGSGCLPRDGARMPDSHALATRPQQSRG